MDLREILIFSEYWGAGDLTPPYFFSDPYPIFVSPYDPTYLTRLI